jgi:uncharacterized membrane protein YbhN (UPF0104 family)
MSGATQRRRRARAWLRVGGSAGILALLFYFLPLGELWAGMRRVSPALWLAVLAGYLGAHVIAVVRWRLMVNAAGAGLGLAPAARCHFAGIFGNLFLPSLVGGDVVRAGLALRLGRSKAGVLLGSLLDRMLDVVVLAGLAGASAALLPRALDAGSRRVFVALAVGAAAAGAAALAALLVLTRRRSWRMRRRMVRLRQAARSVAQQRARVALALLLSLVGQSAFVLLIARIGAACGLALPLTAWFFAYPMAKLVALAPVSQGGIGLREAALVVLLAPFGVTPVLAVAVGLVYETINVAGNLLGGLVSAALGRRAAGARKLAEPLAAAQEKETALRT